MGQKPPKALQQVDVLQSPVQNYTLPSYLSKTSDTQTGRSGPKPGLSALNALVYPTDFLRNRSHVPWTVWAVVW